MERLRHRVNALHTATVEIPIAGSCIASVGSDTPQMLAVYLGMLDVDFEVHEPPELVEQLGVLADRYRRAVSRPGTAHP